MKRFAGGAMLLGVFAFFFGWQVIDDGWLTALFTWGLAGILTFVTVTAISWLA